MKTALIIGAGPAGLTAATELLRRTDIHPIVLESTRQIGGISQTVQYLSVGDTFLFRRTQDIYSSLRLLRRKDLLFKPIKTENFSGDLLQYLFGDFLCCAEAFK